MTVDSDGEINPIIEKLLDILDLLEMDEPYYDDKTIYRGETEKVRPFFAAAIADRLKWYLLSIILVLGATAGLIYQYSDINTLQVSGLLLDLSGAVILGVGLIRTETGIERDAKYVATNTAGEVFNVGGEEKHRNKLDLVSVSSEARDTVDAIVGVSFLFVGFTLQLLAIVSV